MTFIKYFSIILGAIICVTAGALWNNFNNANLMMIVGMLSATIVNVWVAVRFLKRTRELEKVRRKLLSTPPTEIDLSLATNPQIVKELGNRGSRFVMIEVQNSNLHTPNVVFRSSNVDIPNAAMLLATAHNLLLAGLIHPEKYDE